MKVTNKEMPNFISAKKVFTGNSAHAIYEEGEYKIYSYSTLIYSDKSGYFDNAYYSKTTSKLQNMIINIFGINDGILKRT
jgi:hypothetical protein